MTFEAAHPQLVPLFRSNSISKPKLLDLPETKEAVRRSSFDPDSSLNDVIRDDQKPPIEDLLSNGPELYEKCGIWVVFASRIVLDVQDMLRKDAEGG